MIIYRKLIFKLLIIIPFFSFCQTNSDCSDVTISSATVNGNYNVGSYIESDGVRDGDDYYGSTVYYPQNTAGLLPSIIIIPGYLNPELSIQAWGSFLASHGIVCMTIGTNSIFDEVMDRKKALQDALISLKAEQVRINSPLFNNLDTNLIALGGWSMGGGGAQLVAVEDPSIKAILAFCPWIDPTDVSPALLNHSTPILIFSGQIDVVAPPVTHADIQYNYTPSSTNKLKYEVLGGGHTIANTPLGGFGEVGRMGLSWLKKYLVNDSCYCPLLLDVPTTASDYQTNINCPSPNSTFDYKNDLIIYPNPANSTITLQGVLNKNNLYRILSADGKVLKNESLKTSKIDVSYLKKGIYFLEYENQKIKIIKN
jgi:dienelactone hydrolase